MAENFTMNSYLGKQILSLVRDGDYAHAGEEEAIALTLQGVPKDPGRFVLDAGCGRGGTADYIQRHGWGQVTGIDIEAASIAGARDLYPDLTFVACDVCDLADHLEGRFDLLCLFNTFYTFPDQDGALRSLAQVAAPGGRLVIFDYVDRGHYQEAPLMEQDTPFLPLPPLMKGMEGRLAAAGWRLEDIEDIHDHYERWNVDLVERIAAKRDEIVALAGEAAFDFVYGRYDSLLVALRDGSLGGAIIRARASEG